MSREEIGEILRVERWLSGEELVEEDAQRIDVCGRSRLFSAERFGSDVARGAEDEPGRRADALVTGPAGDSEVEDLDLAGGRDHQVLGLDVTVDHALHVSALQTPRDLHDQRRRIAPGEPSTVEPPAECLTFHELVDDPGSLLLGTMVDEADDGRMMEHGRDAGLGRESSDCIASLDELPAQQLDHHMTIELALAGENDGTETTGRQQANRLELARATVRKDDHR